MFIKNINSMTISNVLHTNYNVNNLTDFVFETKPKSVIEKHTISYTVTHYLTFLSLVSPDVVLLE